MRELQKIILSVCLSFAIVSNLPILGFADVNTDTNTKKEVQAQKISELELLTSNNQETEPNNTANTADSIKLGNKYYGTTDSNNTYDYYKFTVPNNGYIDINFSKNENTRFDFQLLDLNLNSRDIWSTPYGSGYSSVRKALPSGTYYLRVDKYYSSDSNKQYNFYINATASEYWEREFNNDSSKANTIKLGSKYYGITDTNNTYDYYKFTVPNNGYIDINFSKNENVKFDFQLLDMNLNSRDVWSTSYGSGYSSARKGLPKGTYYLRVDKYYSSDSNSQYNFYINATASEYWENEYNNTAASANVIKLGSTYHGITDTNNTYDYYKFTVANDGYVEINFTKNENKRFDFQLLDVNLNSFDTWSTPYGGGNSVVRRGVPKGTYYLRVDKYYSSDSNTQYKFSVSAKATKSWEKEFNNTPSSANAINLGITYNGITDTNNTYDYYKFTVANDGYVDIKFGRNQNTKFSFEILDINLKSKGSWYTNYGSGYSSTKVKLSKGTYYLRADKYYSSDSNTQYSFLVKMDSSEKRILTNDIYKYDAGSGKYLTYINGKGYSQFIYLNKSGNYAFTPSSWMIAAGLDVSMPTTSNGYIMNIDNNYITMYNEAKTLLSKINTNNLSKKEISNALEKIERSTKKVSINLDEVVSTRALPKKTLTKDIYKYDAGSGKYLTYINGKGYSQYSYLNTSGNYAFTPSSWMVAAGLTVTMPTSSNGYTMKITNPYIAKYNDLVKQIKSYI